MEPDDAWPCCPITLLFSLSLKRNGVLGELAHNGLLSCYFPIWPAVLRTLPWCWWAVSGALCFALHDNLAACTREKNVQIEGSAREDGAWDTCGVSPALPTSQPREEDGLSTCWAQTSTWRLSSHFFPALLFVSPFTGVLWSFLVLENYFHLQPCYWAIVVIPESNLAVFLQELGSLTDL